MSSAALAKEDIPGIHSKFAGKPRLPAYVMSSGSAAADHWFLTTGSSRLCRAMQCVFSVSSVFPVSSVSFRGLPVPGLPAEKTFFSDFPGIIVCENGECVYIV